LNVECSYDNNGNLTSIIPPDGGTVSYVFDGALPTDETWGGAVAGTVGVAYDANFRVISRSVGAGVANFTYDTDGLLTGAGTETLTVMCKQGC